MARHYLVVSADEYPDIEHSDDCPMEDVEYPDMTVRHYRCAVESIDMDGKGLAEWFDTAHLASGRYPIEYWSSKTWTDYGWEYNAGLSFAADDENDQPTNT